MKIIIIGAVAAGSKAASKLRRLKPEWDITIYTQDTNVAYSECGMPYYIAGSFSDANKLVIRTPDDFRKKNINVFIKHKVTKILPNEKRVKILNLETKEEIYDDYDKLIISTGAIPFMPEIENIHLKNIFQLRQLEDSINIKNTVLQSKSAVIVGGGYIGIELLEAFVKQGLYVTLIQSAPTIMSIFDPEITNLIQKYVLQKDLTHVRILDNDTAIKFVGETQIQKVITKNEVEIPTNIVVLAIGVRPNIELAKNCGIEIGKTGAIKVNNRMETNIKDIYACGDCVEKYHIVAEAPCWIPLGSTANKEGRCCAINVSGGFDEFEGVLGSAVTKYFNFTMSMTGLTEKEALKYGFSPVSVIVKKDDKSGYMPDVESITIKLIADSKTYKILGAQGVGLGDVDKRINTLTTALLSGMTIKEFFKTDITYAPPFSTSIDPMLTAAQKLMQKLGLR